MGPDLEHLRSWIGREETATERLTSALVDRFRATFGQPGSAAEGEVAPLMIHLCLAPPAALNDGLGPDGHPLRGGFLPQVPLPRRMWAGGGFAFHDAIRVGDLVTRRSVIRDVTVKTGRTGLLYFVTVEHLISAEGRPVLTERQDIVYRNAEAPASAQPARSAAPEGRHRAVITPTAPLLFRYSALTFNGHRIHYDHPYATVAEGYPGLVVHGPLQATQLVHFAERIGGRPPLEFKFRSIQPIFDSQDYTLNAEPAGDGLKLWTASLGGPVAMEARARW